MTPLSTVQYPQKHPMDELRILYSQKGGHEIPPEVDPKLVRHAAWVVVGWTLSLGAIPGMSGGGDLPAALGKAIAVVPGALTSGDIQTIYGAAVKEL